MKYVVQYALSISVPNVFPFEALVSDGVPRIGETIVVGGINYKVLDVFYEYDTKSRHPALLQITVRVK